MALNDDVRVRLSAEGLSEVLAALRQLKAEAQKTATAAAKPAGGAQGAFGGLAVTLGGVSKAFAAVGAAVAGIQLIGYLRQAADSAEETGNLADALDLSVEKLSALTLVARQANVPMATLEKSLATYVQKLGDLKQGNAQVANSFANLGVHARELKGKDLAGQLEVVARGFNRMPESIDRTNALMDVFGKKALQLVPALNDIAEQGMDGIVRRGRELGVVLDKNVAARVGAVNNHLALMSAQFSGLFQQFLAGAGPGLIQTFTQLESVISHNQKPIADLGVAFGTLARYVVDIASLFSPLLANFDALTTGVMGFGRSVAFAFESAKLIAQGRFSEWRELVRVVNEENATDLDALAKRTRARFADMKSAWSDLKKLVRGDQGAQVITGEDGGGQFDAGTAILARRREALLAATDREIAITRAMLKAREDADSQSYEQGLLSIREYYDRRRATVEAAARAEVTALERRRAAEALNPDAVQRKQKLAELDSQISAQRAVKNIETQATLARLASEQRQKELELSRQVYDFVKKTAVNDEERHRNAMTDIEAEADAFARLLAQQGRSAEEIAKRRLQFTTQLNRNLSSDESRQQLEGALTDLQTVRDRIQQRVQAGLTTELEGESQLLAVERARLPQLQAMADAMVALARESGDPQRIASAVQLQTQLRGIAAEAERSQLSFQRLATTVRGTLESGLVDLLSQGKQETESWADAFLRLADSVALAVRQMASIALVKALFGPGAAGFASGGFVEPLRSAFASGGLVFGPGTGTSDSVPALLSAGEFVVRARAVQHPGIRSILEAINAGALTDVSQFEWPGYKQMPRFAEGGMVADGGAALSGSVTVGLEPGLVAREIKSPHGRRAVLNLLVENQRAARRALGLG